MEKRSKRRPKPKYALTGERINFITRNIGMQLEIVQLYFDMGVIPHRALDVLYDYVSEISLINSDEKDKGQSPFIKTWMALDEMLSEKEITKTEWANGCHRLVIRELSEQGLLFRKTAVYLEEEDLFDNWKVDE